MLTRAQIQRLAQHCGIGLQAQERDYVQHLLLFLLYSHTQTLIFRAATPCAWSTAAIATQKTWISTARPTSQRCKRSGMGWSQA